MNRILKAPEMVTWEITSKCNLKCKHCSNSLGTDNISDLTLEKCKLIIDKLFEAGVFKISIEGGEPFVRNDIFQILSYLNKKGYIPRITTNATLITDNIAKELSKYNIGLVQISLDGPNKIVYSGIRRSREAFTKALNGINNLKKYNIKISIAMVLMRENIDYILDLLNLAKSLNVDALLVEVIDLFALLHNS